jgi:hypothetical protein
MIWDIIKRAVDLSTLLLLIMIISIILTNSKSQDDIGNFGLKLEQYKQENLRVMSNNIEYMDGRVNKLGEIQDSYQVGTDRRLSIIEERVKWYEADKRQNQKIIQNNINTNTNN